jgi:uncharacterized protein (DUF488 family)
MKRICDALNIHYQHIPQLGIISQKRRNLNTIKDYKILFKEYVKTTIKNQSAELDRIANYIDQNKKIAITCFEQDNKFCHRSEIINYLLGFYSGNLKILYA